MRVSGLRSLVCSAARMQEVALALSNFKSSHVSAWNLDVFEKAYKKFSPFSFDHVTRTLSRINAKLSITLNCLWVGYYTSLVMRRRA